MAKVEIIYTYYILPRTRYIQGLLNSSEIQTNIISLLSIENQVFIFFVGDCLIYKIDAIMCFVCCKNCILKQMLQF